MRFAALRDSRFLRFCVVGTGGAAVDFSVLAFGLHILKLDPYSARLLSAVAAITFTWWGNRQLTFADRRSHGFVSTLKEWFRFFLANGIGGTVNYCVYALFVTFAPEPFSNPYVALVVGVLAGLTLNFTLSNRMVFKTKS